MQRARKPRPLIIPTLGAPRTPVYPVRGHRQWSNPPASTSPTLAAPHALVIEALGIGDMK